METMAKFRYARISAQKARLVADQIRGKGVGDALSLMSFSPRKASPMLRKTLESAIANAEHNHGADIDELRVTAVMVDEGPTLKRWRARAKGSSSQIFKRTSHISVCVGDGETED